MVIGVRVRVCHQDDVCENSVGSLFVGGYCGPLWSSEYECQRVECVFTSPVSTEYGMFVMCCIKCCMSVTTVFSVWMCCLEELYKCLQL